MGAETDYESKIQELKRSLNAVILAHYYQESEIQDVADFVGDSLALAQAAATTKAPGCLSLKALKAFGGHRSDSEQPAFRSGSST